MGLFIQNNIGLHPIFLPENLGVSLILLERELRIRARKE